MAMILYKLLVKTHSASLSQLDVYTAVPLTGKRAGRLYSGWVGCTISKVGFCSTVLEITQVSQSCFMSKAYLAREVKLDGARRASGRVAELDQA